MTDFYRMPLERLILGDTSFVHRGNCEFEIIRQSEGSFMPWSLHSMIEGSSMGLGRKMPCKWIEEPDAITCEIEQSGNGSIIWRFTEGPKGMLRFKMTIVNSSKSDWHSVYVGVHNFPSPRIFRGEQTFVEADGKISEIRELWPKGLNASRGVYPSKGIDLEERYKTTNWTVVPCAITAPFVYRIGGCNEPTPHARWCEDRPVVAGMACERIEAVLSNFAWPCFDLNICFEIIATGERVSQNGMIGIMEGTPEEFVKYAKIL